MPKSGKGDVVSIRPGVRVLSVLRYLNYKPWFALAEFVDNAVQSYLDHRSQLKRADGKSYRLRVAIRIENHDGGRIIIRDNAAGIHKEDYSRAFRAAEAPADSTGLSEFGMGMKSAACWFAPIWSVRTKALGETEEKTVGFDIKKILRDTLEELDVQARRADPDKHYTEITLAHLYNHVPHGRTLGKIREHLAGIYRMFTRDRILELSLNGEPLTYDPPPILRAPYHGTPSAKPILWRKEIDLSLGRGRQVTGFAALRETGSTAEAGFALFRRRRLIQGSGDEGYRPESIFGQSNTYAYQRLFGELELTGFSVSHTKDGFRWGEDEDGFLQKLRQKIAATPVPLLDQAQNYRSKPSRQLSKATAASITTNAALAIQTNAPQVIGDLEKAGQSAKVAETLKSRNTLARRSLAFRHDGVNWEILLELSNDPSVGPWVELGDKPPRDRGKGSARVRELQIRFSVDHPFTTAFAGANAELLEPQLRIACAIALAEVVARESGVRGASTFTRNVNELLRNALSKQVD